MDKPNPKSSTKQYPCPACGSSATHRLYKDDHNDMWCCICGCRFPHVADVFSLPKAVEMGDLRVVAAIEEPCVVLNISWETWGDLGLPAFCGLVPVRPTRRLGDREIGYVRGE